MTGVGKPVAPASIHGPALIEVSALRGTCFKLLSGPIDSFDAARHVRHWTLTEEQARHRFDDIVAHIVNGKALPVDRSAAVRRWLMGCAVDLAEVA